MDRVDFSSSCCQGILQEQGNRILAYMSENGSLFFIHILLLLYVILLTIGRQHNLLTCNFFSLMCTGFAVFNKHQWIFFMLASLMHLRDVRHCWYRSYQFNWSYHFEWTFMLCKKKKKVVCWNSQYRDVILRVYFGFRVDYCRFGCEQYARKAAVFTPCGLLAIFNLASVVAFNWRVPSSIIGGVVHKIASASYANRVQVFERHVSLAWGTCSAICCFTISVAFFMCVVKFVPWLSVCCVCCVLQGRQFFGDLPFWEHPAFTLV